MIAENQRPARMISHPHKTVFVHIPKCGGQSIEAAFLADLGLSWNERAPLLLRPNDQPSLGPPRLAHLRARDYVACHYLSQELFDAYFSFALVRSPFARVLSFYHYLNPPGTLTQFVQHRLTAAFADKANPKTQHYFLRPQVDFTENDRGIPMLDKIFRLEDLATAEAEIRTGSGLKAPIPHANKSERRASLEDFSRDDVAVIRALYEQDFEAFGYSDKPRRL